MALPTRSTGRAQSLAQLRCTRRRVEPGVGRNSVQNSSGAIASKQNGPRAVGTHAWLGRPSYVHLHVGVPAQQCTVNATLATDRQMARFRKRRSEGVHSVPEMFRSHSASENATATLEHSFSLHTPEALETVTRSPPPRSDALCSSNTCSGDTRRQTQLLCCAHTALVCGGTQRPK